MQTKTCTKCGAEKPISKFGSSNRSKDGFAWVCKKCTAKKAFEKYHSDPTFRRKKLDGNLKYIKRRLENDPVFKERQRTYHRDLARMKPKVVVKKPNRTCKIIQEHHLALKDDPEHLSTSFIQKLIGVECGV